MTDPARAVPSPRNVLAIGDVQGCFDCLQRLLARIDASVAEAGCDGCLPPRADAPRAGTAAPRLWLAGDLVNRGPASLEVLRWAMAHEDRVLTVLGNHDLHLLAVAAGIRPLHRSDTLGEILAAPDRDRLIDWLRRRPLAHLEGDTLLVHAGVLPQWSARRAVELGAEVQRALSGPDWTGFLRNMYGNQPARWHDRLEGADRLRVIVNALTRLRFCTPDGTMDFTAKEGAGRPPAGHLPWFQVPGRASAGSTIVFGHWSTLGLVNEPRLLALDTGCVWGGDLTGVRLDDRAVFQVRCPQAQAPGG